MREAQTLTLEVLRPMTPQPDDHPELDALYYRRDLCARTVEALARNDRDRELLATRAAREILADVEAEIRDRERSARLDASRS